MAELVRSRSIGKILAAILAAAIVSGCAVVPRDRFEESQRLTHSLRTENARLKDRVLALEAQNQDYADRALDDLRRLTARDEAIDRLEKSVQGYQDDRDRLSSAYRRMALGLGRTDDDSALGSSAEPSPSGDRGPIGPREDRSGSTGPADPPEEGSGP